MSKLFKLFTTCKIVKGYTRSLIYDLQRSKFFELKNEDLSNFNSNFILVASKSNKKLIQFLLSNELIFELEKDEIEFFPNLDLQFIRPYTINSTFIKSSSLCIDNSISWVKLSEIGVRFVSILVQKVMIDEIKEIVEILDQSNFYNVQIYLDNSELPDNELENISQLVNSQFTVSFFQINTNKDLNLKKFIFSEFELNQTQSFRINTELYIESLSFNNYFHKKIFIQDDEIVPYIDSEISFGKLSEITCQDLKKTVERTDFQIFWTISKDKIDICKDCELRYMCVDNRIPQRRKKDEYFFLNECCYNPYIAKWQGEQDYESVQDFEF